MIQEGESCSREEPAQCDGLVLVGYRGSGKSTVGRLVADRLGRPFIDADARIEACSGRSIAAIFAESGESAFRDWEERVLAEIVDRAPGSILATGGGAVLRESNRLRLRAFGLVVWLRAAPEDLALRLGADPALADRPALTSAGTLAEIVQVLEARLPLYQAAAHAEVETGGRPPAEVADTVLRVWRERCNH